MYLPFSGPELVGTSDSFAGLLGNLIRKRGSANNGSTIVTELASQWANPTDISAILMIIGGDVIQTALAQSTGKWYTPVCFSFGWVSYAFIALRHCLSDGRLLPFPEDPVTVMNLHSGYARENKNWVVSRLMRDMEAWIERRKPLDDNGFRISVFEARWRSDAFNPIKFPFSRSHIYGILVTLAQLVIASVPVILDRDWGVLFITAAGTILAQFAAAIPQWRAEKLPNRQNSDQIFALTTGEESRDVIVVLGRGRCLDLMELCVSETPRRGTLWEKFGILSTARIGPDGMTILHRSGTELRKSRILLGLPYGFWITRIVSIILLVLWIALLISTVAVKESTWYLLLVGIIGTCQNAILATMEKHPRTRGIPLRCVEIISSKKVMDGLMDFEATYNCGRPLLAAFFPGELKPAEKAWWEGRRDDYENERGLEYRSRGLPRGWLGAHSNIAYRYQFHSGEPKEASGATMDLKPIEKQESTSNAAPATSPVVAPHLEPLHRLKSPPRSTLRSRAILSQNAWPIE